MKVLFPGTEHNRRSIYRIPLQLPIRLVVNNDFSRPYDGMSVNLHHRGAEITTDVKVSRGAAVSMGGPQQFVDRSYSTTAGEVRWVHYCQGQYSYGVSFNEDLRWILTLTKESLSALQSNGERSIAESVLNSINDIVFSVNRELRINSFNRAAEKLTGWQRSEVLGKKCYKVFKADSCEECILEESIKQRVPVVNHNIYVTGPQEKRISAMIDSTPLFGPDGSIVGGVQVFHNVSIVPEAAVSIQTLGKFCLTMNNNPVYDRYWRGRRLKDLLKAIISLGGTKVSLEKLAFLLWPDSDGDHAMNSLKMALSRLRRVGGEECSVPANWLAVKHKRVSLVRSVCKVDALEFVRSMKRSSDFKDDKRFSKALGLYTNDFLPDDDTPWTNSFRSHLRNLFIEGVLRLASMKNTENEVLFHFLEQACQSDPLHEDVYACLMKYYIKAGCPAYALNIFNKAEKVIFLQTGLYPGATLQSLAVQAKDSKPDHKLFLSCHIGKK